MPEEQKKYVVQIPGKEHVAYWNEEKYTSNRDKLFEQYPDAQVTEYSMVDPKTVVNDDGQYAVTIPGKEHVAQWDGKKFAANREKLYQQYPNAQVHRINDVTAQRNRDFAHQYEFAQDKVNDETLPADQKQQYVDYVNSKADRYEAVREKYGRENEAPVPEAPEVKPLAAIWQGLKKSTIAMGGHLMNLFAESSRSLGRASGAPLADDRLANEAYAEFQRRQDAGEELFQEPLSKEELKKLSKEERSAAENRQRINGVLNRLRDDAIRNGLDPNLTVARQLADASGVKDVQVIQDAADKIVDKYGTPLEGWERVGGILPMVATSAASVALAASGNAPAAYALGEATMSAFAASSAGSAMKQARDAGASDAQVGAAGIASAAIMYLFGKIPVGRYIDKVVSASAANAVAKAAAGDVEKELQALMADLAKRGVIVSKESVGTLAKEYAKRWGGHIATSAASFAAMGAAEAAVPLIYADPEQYPLLNNMLQAAKDGAIDGLIMGTLAGGFSTGSEFTARARVWKNQGYVQAAEMGFKPGDMIRRYDPKTGQWEQINVTKESNQFGEIVGFNGENDGPIYVRLEDGGLYEILPDNVRITKKIAFADAKKAAERAFEEQGYEEGKNATQEQRSQQQLDYKTAEKRAERDVEAGDPVPESTRLEVKRAESAMQGRKDAVRSEIESRVGRPFWRTQEVDIPVPEGESPMTSQEDMVSVITYKDRGEVYITGEDENGYITVDSEGKVGFVSKADVQTAVQNGEATQGTWSLDIYLDSKVREMDGMAEQERMAKDQAGNLAAIQQKVQEEGRVNVGTPENEVWGKVIDVDPTPGGGVAVIVEGEKDPRALTWAEVASKMAMPLEAKTDNDIVDERLNTDAVVEKYNQTIQPGAELQVPMEGAEQPATYKFGRAEVVDGDIIIKATDPVSGKVVDLAPEMVSNLDTLTNPPVLQQDVDGRPLPPAQPASAPVEVFNDPVANELGISKDFAYTNTKGEVVVDGGKLWAADPKLWAQWNDRNPGRVIPTKNYLDAKLKEIDAEVGKAKTALDAEAVGEQRPDVMEQLRDDLNQKMARQQTISGLLDEYKAAENAAAVAEQAVAKVESQQSQPEVGPFGKIYRQFVGKAREAIDFLLKNKSGEALGALHHKNVGEIALVYGDEKSGLRKIELKHPEVLNDLQGILDSMEIVQQSDNRIKLESPTHFAVVSRDYQGEPRSPWLLTAFEKKNSVPVNTMDTGETLTGGGNDTATPKNAVSGYKGNEISGNTSASPKQVAIDVAQVRLNAIDKRMTEATDEATKTALIQEKANALQGMIDEMGADNFVVATMDNIIDVCRQNGVSNAGIESINNMLEYARNNGKRVRGFFVKGKQYMIADYIRSAEDANLTVVHESKHMENVITGAPAEALKTGVTVQEMRDAVRELTHTEAYEKEGPIGLADEILANAAEIGEQYGIDAIPEKLREAGVKNEEFINFVQNNIQDGRSTNGNRVSSARGYQVRNGNPEVSGGQDGRVGTSRPGALAGTGYGSDEGSRPSAQAGEPAEGAVDTTEPAAEVEAPAAETPEQSAGEQSLTREITVNIGGHIEGKKDNIPLNFSVSSIAEGVGFAASDQDASGNVTFTTADGRVFDGNHPLSVEDVKGEKNTIMNYMMADARKYGTITAAQEEDIWRKYTEVLNRMLEKGLAENGGPVNLASQWQWLGETVFKTVSTNSDEQYAYSLDITRVCKKNEAVINSISAVQSRLGYGITPGQVMDIYLSSIEEGYQVPCPVCYVFSRYIANGKYATIAINGQRKYGSQLVDPSTLTEAEKQAKIDYWVKELEKQDAENAKYAKDIATAKSEVATILNQIDKLGEKILRGGLSKAEKDAAMREIQILDARYKSALNVVSQSSLGSWIKNFAIHKVNGEWQLYDDTFQGFPDEYALDLRLTADTIRKYPAIQRLRKSGGSAAGKEIHFAANNDLGDIPMMVGKSDLKDAPNYYKEAVQATTPEERNKLLTKATERFKSAMIYAQRQSLRGGQRMWSWSDNIERLAPDVFLNLTQMQMLGGALQSYSKQLEGVNLVARMGGYVNGSLMGKGNGYRELSPDQVEEIDGQLYAKGGDITIERDGADPIVWKAPVMEIDGKYYTLVFDNVVGIDAYGEPGPDGQHMKGLFDLNATLDKAGNILVGMNDIHVRTAMADDRVFFIIPWHASGMSVHILTQMLDYLGVDTREFNPQDYTAVQEEKPAVEGKTPINPRLVEFWEAHKNEKDFPCGIKGGIPSGKGKGLSPQQVHYKELRDAIFTEKGLEKNVAWMREIMADEFLSQVYGKVRNRVSDGQMTNGDKKFIYPYEYWDETSTYGTADVNGARYLEYCRRLGKKPKFVGKLDGNPAKDFGNFSGDKGYWKLLIDRRMYGVDGKFQDLTPVTTVNFNPDLIDPEMTEQEFVVTKVADSEGVDKIADRTIAMEERRLGGIATVDYNMNLESAAKAHRKVSGQQLTAAQKKALAYVNGKELEPEEGHLRASVVGDSPEETKALFDAAKKRFGVTKDLNEAGYILPDGTLLDFSGRHMDSAFPESHKGLRQVDHRDIADLNYEEDLNTPSGFHTRMSDFINRGAIRMHMGSRDGSINLANIPTPEQESVIRRIIDRYNGDVTVDFGDGENTSHYAYYQAARPARVMNDISRYFNEGERPEGNMRFSVREERDRDYMRAVESNDMVAAESLVREAAAHAMPETVVVGKDGKPKVVYHGTNTYGFNAFAKPGEDLQGLIWTTDDKRYAEYYTDPNYSDNTGTYHLFVDIKNPLNIGYVEDVVGSEAWNNIAAQLNLTPEELYKRLSPTSYEQAIKQADYIYDYTRTAEFANLLKEYGYDGVIALEDGVNKIPTYGAVSPEQVKSADAITRDDSGNVVPLSERFNTAKEDIRFSVDNVNQDIFVSNAEKAVKDIKMEKATPEQWLKMLESNGGLKAGEDKWLGLSDWLKASTAKTISKEDVQKYIAENKIQIEEVRYSQNARFRGEPMFADRYDNTEGEDVRPADGMRLGYTTPGLSRNREIALTVPTIEPWNTGDKVHFGDAGEGRAVAWVRFGDTWVSKEKDAAHQAYLEADEAFRSYRDELIAKYALQATGTKTTRDLATPEENARLRELMLASIEKKNEWNSPNHKRENVLVIDEIQSKRHQTAREQGGYKDDALLKKAEERLGVAQKAYDDYMNSLVEKYGDFNGIFQNATQEEKAESQRLNMAVKDARNVVVQNGFDPKDYEEYRSIINEMEENESEMKPLQDGWMASHKENVDYVNKAQQPGLTKEESKEFFNKAYEASERMMEYGEKLKPYQEKNRQLQIRLDRVGQTLYDAFKEEHKSTVPAAPFEKNWQEVAMKRMLRLAAEEGYDYIAWTTGEQQAERYSLEQSVSEIAVKAVDNNKYRVVIEDKDGMELRDYSGSGKLVTDKELAELVGKDLAVKLIAGAEESRGKQWNGRGKNPEYYTVKGDDLKVGGNGMKGFYDDMLVRYVNKYGKKWGVKVEDLFLPNVGGADADAGLATGLTMHSIPVTEEMKASVMEGQPMFSIRGILGAEHDEVALQNLDVAKEMEKAGKDAKTIWAATGWEKGVDGKWRNEIRDARRKDGVELKTTNRVGDILEADELFASYPQLADYKVVLKNMKSSGQQDGDTINIDPRENVMVYNGKKQLNSEGVLTVLHELQHAIQDIEGFAAGGSATSEKRNMFKEAVAKDPIIGTFAYFLSQNTPKATLWQVGKKRVENAIRVGSNDQNRHYNEEDRRLLTNLADYIDSCTDEQFSQLIIDADKVASKARRGANDRYNRLAGEVEARNVERRSLMSEEQRKATAPSETESIPRNDQIVRFSIREKEEPKKTIKVYKLMRLGDNKNSVGPLFIDRASEPMELGKYWYDAESPSLDVLETLEPGYAYKIDADGKVVDKKEVNRTAKGSITRLPNKDAVNQAAEEGARWMTVTLDKKGNRSYHNVGINGAESTGTYALRPGWHAGSLPTMRQIGKGPDKNIRDDNFVWVEGEMPADVDYQPEADANPGKDIPTHIPTDGYYMKATNADKVKSQADRVGWYVAGSFKPNRIISDAEARSIIDAWNMRHPNAPVEYDWEREGGRMFNAETMELEEPAPKKDGRMQVYHGSGAAFNQFDNSHEFEGEGAMVHGYGHYFALNPDKASDYAWNDAFNRAEEAGLVDPDIAYIVGNDSFDSYDEMVARYDYLLAKKKEALEKELEETKADSPNGEGPLVDDLTADLNVLNGYRPLEEVLRDQRNVYTVTIPENTGENYIDEMKTLYKDGRRRIADVVRNLPDELLVRTMHGPNWLPEGFKTLANIIERNQYAALEIRERLVDALGTEKAASEVMHNAGFAGITYEGRVDGPCVVVFSDDDIQVDGHVRFSVTNENNAIFISNAEKAVDEIQMGKATPEQWLKMLESKGGLKAGEDKWIGLSDWLKSQDKKTLTKQEVQDYIAQNRIQIEEQDYSEDVNMEEVIAQEYQDRIAHGKTIEQLQAEVDELAESPQRYDAIGDNDEELDSYLMEQMKDAYGDDFEMGYSIIDGAVDFNIDPYAMDEYDFNDTTIGTRKINSTRLSYTTEGLTNKKEIALTVPTIEPWNTGDPVHFGDAGEGRAIAWIRFGDTMTEKGVGDAPIEVKYIGKEPTSKAMEKAIDGILMNWDGMQSVMRNIAPEDQFDSAKSMYENSINDGFSELNDADKALAKETLAAVDKLSAEDFDAKYEGGKKVLFIDEIQSKRHQEGREKGYRDKVAVAVPGIHREGEYTPNKFMQGLPVAPLLDDNGAKIGQIVRYRFGGSEEVSYKAEQFEPFVSTGYAPTEDEAIAKLSQLRTADAKGVPTAPFEKNWHELAMKRMLRYAAENGYDMVAWTTGDQQAERYDLGNRVSHINVYPDKASSERIVNIHLIHSDGDYINVVLDKDGKIIHGGFNGDTYDNKNISDLVGKDLAVKIMSATEKTELSGNDFRIGAEGMQGFYDDILPRFMNKYGKKWGVKVEDIELPVGDAGALTAHSVPVTAEMKASVLEGQPMFSVQEEKYRRNEEIAAVEKGGLGAVIGEDKVAPLYKGIYAALPKNVLKPIVDKAMGSDLNIRKQLDAYLHNLAKAGTTEDETGLLRNLYDQIRNLAGDPMLSDNDVRYMIWKSTDDSTPGDLLSLAEQQAVKHQWHVGEEYPAFSAADDFHDTMDEARKELEADVKAANKERNKEMNAAAAAAQESSESFKDELEAINKAMKIQKNYDKATVDGIVKFAKKVLKEGNVDALTLREANRLLTLVAGSNGKSPAYATRYSDQLLDEVLKHVVKAEKAKFQKLVNVKDKTVAQSGVEKLGRLDVQGQTTIKAFRDYMNRPARELEERLIEISDLMNSRDAAVRKQAFAEHEGLILARDYQNTLFQNIAEIADLEEELELGESAKDTGNIDRKTYNEYMRAAKMALRESRMEIVDTYRDFSKRLAEMISGSTTRAKAFREAEKERVENIHHDANRDMQGVPTNEHRRDSVTERVLNSDIMRFFLKPLATFDQMLRLLGRKNITGEGYLWNRYMRQWEASAEKSYSGFFEATEALDKKVAEVFDKEGMIWSDLYAVERDMPKMEVTFMDGGEMRKHELTQGNLLYIYMVDKMIDGKMKLRKMGISEEDVEAIKKQLDPRFIELADWLQDDYLVERRNKYNEVHERMFGAPMAAIENYFPIKILANARIEEVDLGSKPNPSDLSSTVTGSIIKRRKNSLALDVMHTDAFSLVIEHIQQMEDWAAFAEFRKDLNTLLSYKRFRNQVQNMNTIYGSGKVLWENFKDVAALASGSYRPKVGRQDIDAVTLNVAKGVTAAKIAFRVNTAIKQLLSFPAYLPDVNIGDLAKSMATPGASWNWCMKNLPIFQQRWKSRIAGDTRLMDTDSDWRIWRNEVVKKASQWGMMPNAFVDATTVAVGTKAMYDTRYRRYIEAGYSEKQADRKAKQDATILYNQTQQSSENAFVSAMQKDRTFLSVMLTVFRNSPMSYQRQLHDALRTFGRLMQADYRSERIEFMKNQQMNEGVDEESAQDFAEKEYNRQWWRSAVRVAVFGFILQLAWNLGSNMWYMVFGKNKKVKKKMLKDAATKAIAGPVEGFAGGGIMSDAWGTISSGGKVGDIKLGELPAVSDLNTIIREWNSDKPAAYYDIVNLVVQSGFGVNPETVSDAVAAIVDACNGDLGLAKEVGLLMMRIAQVPQSTLDQLYIDELEMSAKKAKRLSPKQLAERYVDYKLNRGAGPFRGAYSDEDEAKRRKSIEKNFNKKVKERKELNKK